MGTCIVLSFSQRGYKFTQHSHSTGSSVAIAYLPQAPISAHPSQLLLGGVSLAPRGAFPLSPQTSRIGLVVTCVFVGPRASASLTGSHRLNRGAQCLRTPVPASVLRAGTLLSPHTLELPAHTHSLTHSLSSLSDSHSSLSHSLLS